NGVRAAECLPSVHAEEAPRWGKHSAGSRGRYENASRPSFFPGRDESQPPAERRFSSSARSPSARIPAPAKRAGVLVAVPGGYHRLRPETAYLDVPVPGGQPSG